MIALLSYLLLHSSDLSRSEKYCTMHRRVYKSGQHEFTSSVIKWEEILLTSQNANHAAAVMRKADGVCTAAYVTKILPDESSIWVFHLYHSVASFQQCYELRRPLLNTDFFNNIHSSENSVWRLHVAQTSSFVMRPYRQTDDWNSGRSGRGLVTGEANASGEILRHKECVPEVS